ncbi:MOSC domain-containing protein [Halomarina halobia]|uniref:MOSC domain-containing protein n=1 Tax=Halomarina halobia TaxID=3033386 RepID=A0ABD6A7A0_9EURY|nr:MOSC domain-containing protein [Halomarina sp. PSR21]
MSGNRDGRVAAIHTAPEAGAEMESRTEASAVEGRGLEGDRYFERRGTWSGERGRDLPHADRALTLFEVETLALVERDAGISLEPADHRRNVTTEDVAVSHLVDERFRIGEAVCEGVDLCEPCAYLESLTEKGVLGALVHRGGLNARIVSSGTIRVGDPIRVL